MTKPGLHVARSMPAQDVQEGWSDGGQRKGITESPLHAEVRREQTLTLSVRYKEDRVSRAVHSLRKTAIKTRAVSIDTCVCNESPLRCGI